MAVINITQPAKGGGEGEFNGWYRDELHYMGDGYYDIPAGYILEKFIVLPGANTSLKVGRTFDGDEVFPPVDINVKGECYVVNIYAPDTTRIYLTGLTPNSIVIYFKRLVYEVFSDYYM